MLYTFFREGGFYPMEFGSDGEAKANAACNLGTIKVVNEFTKDTIWTLSGNWLDGIPEAVRILEQARLGASAAGSDFNHDEIAACIACLQDIYRRQQL